MAVTIADPGRLGFDADRLSRINRVMQGWVDRGTLSGVSTLVARRGEVVHFSHLGLADIEERRPMGPEAVFRIYSMTKPITAVGLMTLFEQGKFQLFDPVAKYIPAFAKLKVMAPAAGNGSRLEAQKRPAIVRDLLTHTAGLTYDFLEESRAAELYRRAGLMGTAGLDLEEFINELLRLPLAFQPGSRWSYGYANDLAAYLIELLADEPLADYLERCVFRPLGMTDTGFAVPPDKQDRVAAVYGIGDLAVPGGTLSQWVERWRAGVWERVDPSVSCPLNSPTWARGGHGLFSTVEDYWRFAQMLCNGGELDGVRILGRKTVDLMYSNHLPPELLPFEIAPDPPYYGYGFGLGSSVVMDPAATRMPGSVGEHAWSGAARTAFWVDPVEEMVCVLMCQYRGFEFPEYDFRAAVYQALAGS